ncbi:SPOR domain-containing protein [Bartonella machadoae]|uniref:SPOR domain-containing protein n=1 Tax=Bartonella machadoae TaxID=2893471 RepID=UPI001F4CF9BB|nr:SPOR domain-containing protein [Bartonella machadoae]UNE55201.1 SPOR domain-containing protein [Bartonella machadoae]
MSDNNRKNPHETKQDHEHHDPLDRLTRIFNPNKQNGNQNDYSSLQTDRAASHRPEPASSPKPSSDNDFDLSFLEAELENNLTNNLPLDDQKRQWGNREATSDTLSKASLNRLEQNKSLSGKQYSSAVNHDEEQILDALSPLPIQKNQTPPNRAIPTRSDPFFGKSGFNERSENFFFNEAGKHDNIREDTTQPTEQTHHFSQTISQQKETSKVQQNHESNQDFYSTPVNHPYKVSADQEILATEYYSDLSHSSKESNTFSSSSDLVSERQDTARNERATDFLSPLDSTRINKPSHLEGFPQESQTTDYPQFYEEEAIKQGSYAETAQEYHNTQVPYTTSAENIFEKSNEKGRYHQNNLNHIDPPSECPNTEQKGRFFAHNYTDRGSPPPNVDTYKFAEEIVEKTGPIMVPEVPYEAPEYDVPTDDLKEEFADVLNVGNVSADDFSRHQQQNDVFNEIFHQTMENSKENIHINSQNQNINYSSTDNVEYHSSSFTENPLYRGTDEITTHASNTSPLKNFIVGKTLTKSVVLLTLIAVGFFSYFHFFMPSQKNETTPIIRADDTPFKFKQETTETKNDVAHNLDIYKQTTGQSEKQENTQQSLIDSSEQPEDLTELDQQESTNLSSSSPNQSDVEDAVTEAMNHTIPTREVQTVIVNQDGTVVLAPKHYTEEKPTDEPEETIDQTADGQPQDSSAIISADESNTNNEETEHTFTNDIDKIIAENTSVSHLEGKVIPLPSRPERNAEQQKYVDSRPLSSSHVTTQNSESYYVQLASQPTHALATVSLKNIKSKFGFLIGDRPLNIQSALIPEKGTYYRVRIQTYNRNDAINLCEEIKNSGGNCFITR